MQKRWELLPACPADFSAQIGVEPAIIGQLLWNRGLRTREEAAAFFEPSWERDLHDPGQFRHGPGAAERVLRAVEQGERMTVHGDYDADGITGAVLLMTTLRELEKARGLLPPAASMIDYYIPHRDKEGYGLHRETVSKLSARGTGLLLTVDCGIASVEEIRLAKEQGMETVVVDHHQFGETLPEGWLIHPGLPEETYPFKHLAAVGVAFKFACALLDEARRRGWPVAAGWEKWLLDLVAIATVTDMVPLIGENRMLETYGLRVLNKTRRPGLRALFQVAGLEIGTLTSESIGFGIGPRINAAGRMDHASLALRLLLAETDEEALRLAEELEGRNRERQEATKRMMEEAEQHLASMTSLPRVLVLWHQAWSPALVGLVAGRFLDRYGRPSVVVGQHEGKWIGSGRSFSSYNITEAVREAGDGLLTRSGGHVQACGFALGDESHISLLAERLQQQAEARLRDEDLMPRLAIDAEIFLRDIDWPLVDLLEKMEPFGEGNRRPVFVSKGCRVVSADTVGQAKNHLRLTLLDARGRRLKAIGFKIGDRLPDCRVGSDIDLVYHVDVNEWNGRKEIQLKSLDLIPSGERLKCETSEVVLLSS